MLLHARRTIAPRAVAALALIGALATAPRAEAAHQTYLSLGDSLAFGVGQDQSLDDVSNGDRGYTSLFADYLGWVHGHRPHVVNLGISGETTASFTSGTDRNGPAADPLRNTNYQGLTPVPTQMELLAAVLGEELAAGRSIDTVSISLGANDLFLLQADPAFQAADLLTKQAMLFATLGQVAGDYAAILGDLRALLPAAEILVLGTYDPFGGAEPLARQAIVALNDTIAAVAAPFGATYVDVFTPFLGNELAYTYIWDGLNVHPTPAGYRAIAGAMVAAVPEPGSLALLGLGALGALGLARRRRTAA